MRSASGNSSRNHLPPIMNHANLSQHLTLSKRRAEIQKNRNIDKAKFHSVGATQTDANYLKEFNKPLIVPVDDIAMTIEEHTAALKLIIEKAKIELDKVKEESQQASAASK